MLRNLHPADYNPARIKKFDKDFAREPYFKDIKFRVKIRDIHNVERKHCMNNVVFGYVNKKRYPIHVSNNTFNRHVDLLWIREEGKKHYDLINDFINTFMYDHMFNRGGKHLCCYCLQDFSTAKIL